MSDIGTKAAAEILGVTQSTVAKLCREEKIPATQDAKGCPWHMKSKDVEEYKAKMKHK